MTLSHKLQRHNMKAEVLLMIGVLTICGIRYSDSFVCKNSNKDMVIGIPTTALTSMNQIDDDGVTTTTSTITTVLLNQILKVAIDASEKAGSIILGNAGGVDVTERKANSRDLLTLIDPLCEKVGFFGAVVADTTSQIFSIFNSCQYSFVVYFQFLLLDHQGDDIGIVSESSFFR